MCVGAAENMSCRAVEEMLSCQLEADEGQYILSNFHQLTNAWYLDLLSSVFPTDLRTVELQMPPIH